MDTNTKLYKQDFYRWTREQAALLEARQFDTLDMANLVEEITSLGISHKHALGSHLKNLVMHLLTWHYQPSGRQIGHSWRSSIHNARDDIAVILERVFPAHYGERQTISEGYWNFYSFCSHYKISLLQK